jgi:hypothetical protein
VEVYRTDNLDYGDYEFVDVPAVIRGRNTRHIGLGIVTLDLQSSGEHSGTFFLTPRGVIDQGFDEMKPADEKYLASVTFPMTTGTPYISARPSCGFRPCPRKSSPNA